MKTIIYCLLILSGTNVLAGNTMVGQQAESINIQSDSFDIQDYKGQYVVLHFWASWSKSCRSSNLVLQNAYVRYGKKIQYQSKPLTIVSISLDYDSSKMENAQTADKLYWSHHIKLDKGWDSELLHRMSIQIIPYFILIDPQGRIILRTASVATLELKLKSLASEK